MGLLWREQSSLPATDCEQTAVCLLQKPLSLPANGVSLSCLRCMSSWVPPFQDNIGVQEERQHDHESDSLEVPPSLMRARILLLTNQIAPFNLL